MGKVVDVRVQHAFIEAVLDQLANMGTDMGTDLGLMTVRIQDQWVYVGKWGYEMIYSNDTIIVLDLLVANGTDVTGHHRKL